MKPNMIYNKSGDLVNKRAFKTARIIEDEVRKLYEYLLKQGMTIVEGRALLNYLKGSVDISATLTLMKAQCKGHK